MGEKTFLKNGLYYLLCGSFPVILGQAIFLMTCPASGHQVFEFKQASHWLIINTHTNIERLNALFLYQPMLVVGMAGIYLALQACRLVGYNQIFFAFTGGILNTLLVLGLVLRTAYITDAVVSPLLLIISTALGFFSGFFSAPFLLKPITKTENVSVPEMAK